MSNPQKRKEVYHELVEALESVSRSDSVKGLERTLLKAHHLLLNADDFSEESGPESDFAGEMLDTLRRYYGLRRNRQKKVIGEGEREITTEDEAYESLMLTNSLIGNLIIPNFRKSNDFSNSLFNDNHNLGLAYLHAVVSAVADQYIPPEEARIEKLSAVDVVKGVIRLWDQYQLSGELAGNENLKARSKIVNKLLEKISPKYMRSFELVPTTQKSIHHEGKLTRKLKEEVTRTDSNGEILFKPTVVFPIAQGGNEFGARLSIAYEDKGHLPVTYPLFYSRKTRHHRFPWIENDAEFLGQSLEGEDILVVEDWVTTGNTLRGIINQIEGVLPGEIRIATLKRDRKRSRVPILDKHEFYVGEWGIYQGDKSD